MGAMNDLLNKLVSKVNSSVKTEAQTLTAAQKAQARENIGAISEVDVPVKGKDYWTEADQESIVQQVIAALGTPVFGRVDENKHITLSGHFVDGTYTISFEDTDGFVVADVGTIVKGEEIPASGYAELTWYDNVKLNKQTGAEDTSGGYCASGHVEIIDGYMYEVTQQPASNGHIYGAIGVVYYDASGNYVSYAELWTADSDEHSVTLEPPSNADTFRLRAYYSTNYVTEQWRVHYEKIA